MSFSESLESEIFFIQAQLDAIETERRRLKKKLRGLIKFLEEYNSNLLKESENER